MRAKMRWNRAVAVLVGMLVVLEVCASAFGVVRRRMTIRSNPPGAMVYVDDYELGTTPISTNFIYYGTRKIRLVKDGYETLTVLQPVPTPWYEYPVIDFISENFVPGELRDRRTFSYQLRPQMVVPTEHLMQRAENLRGRMQQFVPVAPPVVPTVPGPEAIPRPQPMTPQPMTPQPMTPRSMTPPAGPSLGVGPNLQPLPADTGGRAIHPLPPGGWPSRPNR